MNYINFCKDVDEVLEEDLKIATQHAHAFKSVQPKVEKKGVFILNDKPDSINDVIAKLRKRHFYFLQLIIIKNWYSIIRFLE